MYWLAQAPMWLIGLLMVAGLMIAHEIAFRIARRSAPQGAKRDQSGYLTTSALTLLGLLTAFTFSAADQRFNLRRELAIAEANAIGTAYLRFQTLDEPWKTRLSHQMLQYVEARSGLIAAAADPGRLAASELKTETLQGPMWDTVADEVRRNPTATVNPALVQAVNEMFDLAASRRAVYDARIPATVLRILLLYGLVAAGVVGYAGATDRRDPLAIPVFVLLALALCLILDLDRPRSGTIRVDQAPMARAISTVRRSEAAKAPASIRPAMAAPIARSVRP